MAQIAQQVDEVRGKVAIVTGAASGIGRAIVELLHARGAKVVAEDVDPAVEALARDGVAPLVADVAADGSAERAVALAEERFGGLDLLVNNAGVIVYKPVVELSRAEWERIVSVNLTGAFLHSKAAMAAMLPRGRGAIVNIASYASFMAFEGIAPYAASKGGLGLGPRKWRAPEEEGASMAQRFTSEFEEEAVRLVRTSGRTKREVAADLGVGVSTLTRWLAHSRDRQMEAPERPPPSEDVAAELKRLRRENEILRQERDILKKATAFFVKEGSR